MKPFTHPKDVGLLFPRKLGKRKRVTWQEKVVAKAAPDELAYLNEASVQALLEAELEGREDVAFLHIPEIVYVLLKEAAGRGSGSAIDALARLTHVPDLLIFQPTADGRCLVHALELKKKHGSHTTKGQRDLTKKLNGRVVKGYKESSEAMREMLA